LPYELWQAQQWDLSPLRPWEWWVVDIGEFNEALQILHAYREGVREANDENEASQLLDATRAKNV
jgi:hypothetical protein